MTSPAPDYGSMILALAKDLANQGHRIAGQDSLIEELGGLRDLVELFNRQQGQIDQLTRQVQVLSSTPAGDELWDWTSMDQGEAEQAWDELRAWVEGELSTWYVRLGPNDALKGPLAQKVSLRLRVPECWPAHRDVVIELSWLYQEWVRLYRDGSGSPARAGDWHSRFLPGVLHRIRNASTAAHCYTRHTDLSDKDPTGRVDGAEPFDAEEWIRADIASRPEPEDD